MASRSKSNGFYMNSLNIVAKLPHLSSIVRFCSVGWTLLKGEPFLRICVTYLILIIICFYLADKRLILRMKLVIFCENGGNI